MQTYYQAYTSSGLDADGIANDVAYSGGGYALSAAGPGDGLAHGITILGNAVTNHSDKTFTVTGTDANDAALSEGIAGPNGNVTVTSTRFFKTVTSVTVSATTGADTFDIGWNASSMGAAIYPDFSRNPVINTMIFCRVPSGTPTYGVQFTADLTPAGTDDTTSWLAHATIAAKSATFSGQIAFPVTALRLAFTATGPVNMTVIVPYKG